MVYFVIAGEPGCPNYAHAVIVADYLQKNLPNFNVKKLELAGHEWSDWLTSHNTLQKWTHRNSPLIYKELLHFGGVPHYIGGLSEFWEYCSDYYGLESLISAEELANFAQNNLKFYDKKKNESNALRHKIRTILIYGPDDDLAHLLVKELFEVEGLAGENGIRIRFFDDEATDMEEESFVEPIEYIKVEYNARAKAIKTLGMGMTYCDLVIITESFDLDEMEYKQVIIKMRFLADVINNCCKPSLRVVFANEGASCFAATMLAEACCLGRHIVVVASDKGLAPLNVAARRAGTNVEKLCAPPVWGFLGHNDYVDIGSALKKCPVFKPYARAINSPDNTTLPDGTICTELRFIHYMIPDEKSIHNEVCHNRKIILNKVYRTPTYAKVRATISLLNLWYSPKRTHNEIISLGVLSDGSYDIPKGLIFAQPSILINGEWWPYANYPVPRNTRRKIKKAISTGVKLLNMGITEMVEHSVHLTSMSFSRGDLSSVY